MAENKNGDPSSTGGGGLNGLPDLESAVAAARTQDQAAKVMSEEPLETIGQVADTSLEEVSRPIIPLTNKHHRNRWILAGTMVLLIALIGLGMVYAIHRTSQAKQSARNVQLQNSVALDVDTTTQPLKQIAESQSGSSLTVGSTTSAQLAVNGALHVNGAVVIAGSTAAPTNPTAGQLYYNQTDGRLYFYNGTSYIDTTYASTVTSALENIVTSIQGLKGDVGLAAGQGISVNGTTISNTGVISLSSASPNVVVQSDGKGGYTITDTSSSANAVLLQATTPGSVQTGSINIGGTVIAASFQGDGSALGNLRANALASGTVADARLSTNVTLAGNSYNGISQLVRTDGLGALPAVSAANLTNLNASSITAGTVADNRLSANVTLAGNSFNGANQLVQLDTVGALPSISGINLTNLTADSLTTGTVADARLTPNVTLAGNAYNGISQLVQTTGTGALPTISGANLTSLNASNITAGTVADARLTTNVTLAGNSFNGAGQLIQADSSGNLPAISGINVNNLNASNITAGTLSNLRLGANVTLAGNTFNGANQLTQLTNLGYLPVLNGSNLTSLNASSLSGGTIADARLSSNVDLLASNQTITGAKTFSQAIQANTLTPSSSLTVGATGQAFTLQGSGSSTITATQAGYTTTLGFSGTPVANTKYVFDSTVSSGTYTVCTTNGNCVGTNGGVATPGGTANKLARFTGTSTVANSSISDNGATTTVQYATNSTTAFQIQNAAGTSNLFVADTTNTRIGIGVGAPAYTLDVNGDINSATALRVGGVAVCNNTGCIAASNSGLYVQNGTVQQANTNFNIQSAGASSVGGVITGATGQTADLFDLTQGGTKVAAFSPNGNLNITGVYNINGSQIASTNLADSASLANLTATQTFSGNNTFTGNILLQNATDSVASSFAIKNAAGTANVFVVDTTDKRVGINTNTPGYGLDVNGDVNIAMGSSYRIGGVALCGPGATCAPASGSNYYLQNSTALQTNTNFNIQSTSAASVGGIIRGATSQTADLLRLQDGAGLNVVTFANEGQLSLGRNGAASGSIALQYNGSTGSTTLQSADPGSTAYTLTFPAVSGTVCVQNSGTCGFAASSGSSAYVQNGTTQQTANFNIVSAGAASIGALVQGAASASKPVLVAKSGATPGVGADLLQLQNSGGTVLSAFSSAGQLTLGNVTTGSLAGTLNLTDGTNDGFVATFTPGTLTSNRTFTLADNGGTVCTSVAISVCTSVYGTASGSGNYIQNNVGAAQVGNINIISGAASSPATSLQGATSATVPVLLVKGGATPGSGADLLQLQNSSGTSLAGVTAAGNIYGYGTLNVQTTSNNATAFQVQDSSNNSLLAVNTLTDSVTVANAGVAGTVQVGNTTGAVAQTINIGNNTTTGSTTTLSVGSAMTGSSLTLRGSTAKATLNSSGFVISAGSSAYDSGVLGSTQLLTSNNFTSTTYWTDPYNNVTKTSTSATLSTATSHNNSEIDATSNNIGFTAGSVYQVTFTLGSVTGGTLQLTANTNTSSSGAFFTNSGTYTVYLRASNNGQGLSFSGLAGVGFSGTISNVSVYKITTSTALLQTTSSTASSVLEIRTGPSQSTFVGYQAGQSNLVNGQSNTAFGSQALQANATGSYNVAVGTQALLNSTTGLNNVAVGNSALNSSTSGNSNIAVGSSTLSTVINGSDNIAIGNSALGFVGASVSGNIAIGTDALWQHAGTQAALSIGYKSGGYNCNYGNYNCLDYSGLTAVGYQAGTNLAGNGSTGAYSILFGYQAGYNDADGGQNNYLGYQTGYNNVHGSGNVLLGYQAGYSSSGSNNVFLGYQAGYSETGSNKLYISNSNTSTPLIGGDFSAQTVTITGTLTVKATTINGTLTVTGNATTNGHIITGNASGTTTANYSAAAVCTGGTPTASVTGNDTSGKITIKTGTGTCSTGNLGYISFANSYGATPNVTITPTSATGATLQYYVTPQTNLFYIATGNTPAASTTYTYNYHVEQ